MATKPVKNFFSSHAGAPVLSGTAGSRIAIFDACLVNGYNLQTLDSLVVSAGVLTGTKAGHGFVPDQVIVTSANESDLISEWTVTTTTSNTFNAVATGVPNTTGTGTLTAKAAPLGWSKVYSGTNKAVYRSNDPESCRMYLRVDDTAAQYARVVGYESMTDVDTGTGAFPTNTQLSGGFYWNASSSASTSARLWKLIGSSKHLHWCPRTDTAVSSTHHYEFGDFVSEKPGDAFNCLIEGHTSAGYSAAYGAVGLVNYSATYIYAPRSYTQIGASVPLHTDCSAAMTGSGAGGNAAYPSLANNGLILGPIIVKEASANVFRAMSLPGVYATPQTLPLSDGDMVSDIAAFPGRKLLATACGFQGAEGRLFLDITGPW